MGDAKTDWLGRHLRCLECGAVPLAPGDDGWRCRRCDTHYPRRDHCIDFIDPARRAGFNITDNARPSAHRYGPPVRYLLDRVAERGGMALDCGAGHKETVAEHLVQVEIMPYDNVDVLAVNQALPFADASFDVVLSLDVLEHVTDPFASARELARVLKPGGLLYVDLPFLQVEHGYPHHYFNATRMGLRQLFDGLLDVERHIVPRSGHPAHVVWMALHTYRTGLPKALRERFSDMTVGEILSQPWVDFRDMAFGESLSEEIRWKLASTTRAIMSKPGAEGIDAGDVPDFR